MGRLVNVKYIDEYHDKQIISRIVKMINKIELPKRIKIMEVCGTHTMSIRKHGIKSLLPDQIELISGPGCPVCVTPESYINHAISLAKKKNVIITTFADLMRVPGKFGSLQEEKSRGGDIRIVYSPLEAVEIARKTPEKEVIFLAVGFETTIPTIALSVKKANSLGLNNFYLLQSLKTMPPVLKQLLSDKEVEIDGFILPGHVSTVIGSNAFAFLSKDYNIPGIVAGFEPADIIMAIYRLSKILIKNNAVVENLYNRLVKEHGNRSALAVIDEIFGPEDSYWRGLGIVKNSGLRLKNEYLKFAVETKIKFNYKQDHYENNNQCICGDILKGKKKPTDCKLFSRSCTPSRPLGPCMVSQEGTCAAYYNYRGKRGVMY